MTNIIDYNSKKYKKQSNGKWLEVSKYGTGYLTQTEHLSWEKYFKRKAQEKRNDGGGYAAGSYQELGEWHKKQASKLSDKEHTDAEVGVGSMKESENQLAKITRMNISGYTFKRSELSSDDVVELEARGKVVIDEYGDSRPDEKIQASAKKLVEHFKSLGFDAGAEPQEKGWMSVFITEKR